MKKQLKPLAISLCMLGMISVPAFADETTTTSNRSTVGDTDVTQTQTTAPVVPSVHKKHHRKQQMQDQIQAQQNANSENISTSINTSNSTSKTAVKHSLVNAGPGVIPTKHDINASKKLSGPDAYINHTSTSEHIGSIEAANLPLDVDVPGQSFVSSGPYIGIPLVYSGSNLIINSPNINEDVALLNIRKSIRQRLAMLGREEADDHAHLLLSGIVETQAIYKDPGVGPTSSDIDLTASELDGYVLGPSSWTSGLFALTYDNGLGSRVGFDQSSRVQNSRVFVNKAFIVLGDFSQSPVYASMGQMYVPFGTYSTNMVSSPLTKILGRVHERAFLLGYQHQGQDAFYGAGYVFRGDTHAGSTSRLNNGGINLGYRFVAGNFSGNFGGGVIANIADSEGLQSNGNGFTGPQWGGFAGDQSIMKQVPAMDLRALFSIGSTIDLLAEYIGALTSFGIQDLTYNSHSAKPAAIDLEAAYTFTMFDRPTSVAIGYDKSREALGLEMSEQRYSIVMNTSWWKDTLQSIEYRHDQNYAASASSTGSGGYVTGVINGTGKPDNTVTAQFDLYF